MTAKNSVRVTIRKPVLDQLVSVFGNQLGFTPNTASESSEFVNTLLCYMVMDFRRNQEAQ